MPKRAHAHVLEDRSRNKLTTLFETEGWTVERITRDYGEDLLVRIFLDGRPSSLFFFVQAKATTTLSRMLIQSGAYLSVPVSADHLELWNEFWPPVFLTVWDERNDVTYWECVQTSVAMAPRRRPQPGAARLWVPTVNILDRRGIQRILARTETRFSRLEREKQGAEHLVAVLREKLGLAIEYDPQFGMLQVPEGRFVPAPGGSQQMFPFGRFARELQKIARLLGVSPDEAYHIVIGTQLGLLQRVLNGESVIIRSPTGEVLTEWHSPADVGAHYIRLLESDDGP